MISFVDIDLSLQMDTNASPENDNGNLDERIADAKELLRSGAYDPSLITHYNHQRYLLRTRYDVQQLPNQAGVQRIASDESEKATLLRRYYAGLCARVRCLPPEILEEIFIWARYMKKMPHTTHPPFTISWVCANWRRVALACPNVWSYLAIPVMITVCSHCDREPGLSAMQMLYDMIRRSGTYPLDLRLADLHHKSTANRVFSLLAPLGPRLRSLRVCWQRSARYIPDFLTNLGPLPLLKDLYLENTSKEVFDKFNSVESLRSL
jgi:hypothetical protein